MQKKVEITLQDGTTEQKQLLTDTVLQNAAFDGFDLYINNEFIGGRPKDGRG